MMDSFVLIGNPENKRTLFLQQARAKLGLAPAVVVPYLDVLKQRVNWEELMSKASRPIIRIDSPGENFKVEREIIAIGACEEWGDDGLFPLPDLLPSPTVSVRTARNLIAEKGRIYYPSQWFRGYCRLLGAIKRDVMQANPQVSWMNDPREIAIMFDKRRCHQLLSEHSIQVPRLPQGNGILSGYDHLREAMSLSGIHRVFVKLAFGSSASGVMAYQINPSTGAEIADTTIGVAGQGPFRTLYNTRKLQRYTDSSSIRELIQWLASQGMHVEQWISKISHEGRSMDFRQLIVGGEACHRVARLSRSPITNLHLRNERASLEEVGIQPDMIQSIESCASHVSKLFPDSFVAGLDLVIGKRRPLPYVIDINPFGDLLLHVKHNQYDPYEWEMIQMNKDRILS
ncbi:hypothetical protein D3C73_672320 [compost metagenome]